MNNSVVEKLIGGGVYNNKSDCYIVDSDGTVLMSLEPETQITDDFDNIFDFIQEKTQSYNEDYLERMKKLCQQRAKEVFHLNIKIRVLSCLSASRN